VKWLVGRIKLLWERWYWRADIADAAWQSAQMDVVEERDRLRAAIDGLVNRDVCHACGHEGACSYDVYADGDVSVNIYAFCVSSGDCVARRRAHDPGTMDRDMVRAAHALVHEDPDPRALDGCRACGTEDTGRFLKGGTRGYCDDCDEPPFDDDLPF
jgi:hypothetical protein